ncbi:MAG: hypothetical protein H7834_10180 [Magnetococcus sp. YQC-9]
MTQSIAEAASTLADQENRGGHELPLSTSSFLQGCVQDAGVVSKKQKTTPAKAARSAFFAKDAKNASYEERSLKSKAKSKPWERNLPDPLFLFTNKNHTFQAGCGLEQVKCRISSEQAHEVDGDHLRKP